MLKTLVEKWSSSSLTICLVILTGASCVPGAVRVERRVVRRLARDRAGAEPKPPDRCAATLIRLRLPRYRIYTTAI